MSELSAFNVTEKAMRPASKERHCFYCGQDIGQKHKTDCVLVQKNVRIKVSVEYEIKVPNSWDKAQVEFHRNEGSWCCSNIITELMALDEKQGCICNFAKIEFLNDVSEGYLNETGEEVNTVQGKSSGDAEKNAGQETPG